MKFNLIDKYLTDGVIKSPKIAGKILVNRQYGINSIAEIKRDLVSLQTRTNYAVNNIKTYMNKELSGGVGEYKALTEQYKILSNVLKSINDAIKKL